MLHTRRPQTTEAANQMSIRNQKRLELVKRKMGERYAHHPVNHVQRKESEAAFTSS